MTYTDPQAAAVGAADGRFSGTALLSGRRQDRHVHARVRREQRLPDPAQRRRAADGRLRARPGGGRVAAAGHAGDPRPRPARRPGRHHPAVPDVLGDLRRRAEGAPRGDRGAHAGRRDAADGETVTTRRRRRASRLRADRRRDRRQRRASGWRPRGGRAPRAPTSSSPAAIPTGCDGAASEVGAQSTAAFDANDLAALEAFFEAPRGPIDHVMVTAGRPVLRAAGRDGLRRGAPRAPGAS